MLSIWNNPFLSVRTKSDTKLSTKSYIDRLFKDTFEIEMGDLFHPIIQIGIEQKADNGNMVVSVDLPGIAEEDINVELVDNVITIKGERKTQTSAYSVQKSFTIPEGYDPNDIKAELKNGVLTFTFVSKTPIKSEPKKIAITTK